MSVTVCIPTALRQYAGQEARTLVEAKTVGDALQALIMRHPALKTHLFEEGGRLRSFVNVYVGERDVRELGGTDAPVREGDTVLIVPSVAGG
jgi:adenylyltransferase/sulfurtransferase